MKLLLSIFFLYMIVGQTFAQDTTSCLLQESTIDGKPALVIDLKDEVGTSELTAIFKKNGYKYKGFIWDNGLWEVVNQKDFEMLRSIEKIDEEEDRLVVIFMNVTTQQRFSKLICPILANPDELDNILANRKRY